MFVFRDLQINFLNLPNLNIISTRVWILTMEEKIHHLPAGFMFWLFVKNWMFCTVNAILFDLKDYADDANREIKTFVVRVGLRKTIFTILVPLTLTGFLSFLFFSLYNHFIIGDG